MAETLVSGSRRMAEAVKKITGWKLEKVKDHVHKSVDNPPMMRLVIEAWKEGENVMVAVSHYGELNGDAMADPDMLFAYVGGELLPLHFQNDYVAFYQRVAEVNGKVEVKNQRGYKDLLHFADMWARNLEAEGYFGRRA